jgi:histidinol-phosphatase (PHP family)
VNTGAIARGYRKEPYPALEIVEYVKSKGGKLILSSDAHKKENVAFQFEKWQKYVSV